MLKSNRIILADVFDCATSSITCGAHSEAALTQLSSGHPPNSLIFLTVGSAQGSAPDYTAGHGFGCYLNLVDLPPSPINCSMPPLAVVGRQDAPPRYRLRALRPDPNAKVGAQPRLGASGQFHSPRLKTSVESRVSLRENAARGGKSRKSSYSRSCDARGRR